MSCSQKIKIDNDEFLALYGLDSEENFCINGIQLLELSNLPVAELRKKLKKYSKFILEWGNHCKIQYESEREMHRINDSNIKYNNRKKISRQYRIELFEKLNGCCFYCGTNVNFYNINIDHIEPLSRGGTDDLENLAISCKSCNSSKMNKNLEQFRSYIKSINHEFSGLFHGEK